MIRIVVGVLIVGLLAGCAGLGAQNKRGNTSTRHVPEPTTPGIHVSGQVRIGVSTGG